MKKLIIALCVLLVAAAPAAAGAPQIFEGVLNGAPYKILVPETWNGTLVFYAHLYYNDPVSYSHAEAAPGGEPMENFLLSNGYALAGSTFRGTGWQVKEGTQDLIALKGLFNDLVGKPAKRILVGYSMGSLIALKSAEEVPLFDGAIPMGSLAGTTSAEFDRESAFAFAYATLFGWPANWGTWYDVRDDMTFLGDVYLPFLGQLTNPANIGKFEFIRLLLKLPLYGYYPNPEDPATGMYPGGQYPSVLWMMWAATEARAEVERRAMGYVYGNADHVYSLTPEEKYYLNFIDYFIPGAEPVDADLYLDSMNAGTSVTLMNPQKKYAEKYFDPTGDLRIPVLSVHSVNDHHVPAYFETRLLEKVRAASREDRFLQVYTDGFGHCTFTQEQLLAAIRAMESWLDTGEKPDADPTTSEFFPASRGFVVPTQEQLIWPIGKK